MDAFETHKRLLTRDLVELRNELVRVAPELDDSSTREPGDEKSYALLEEWSLAQYSDYYFALKELARLHRQFDFGVSPDIPSGFSERLCRHLLGLEKAEGRDYDAIGGDGQRIEIKATGSLVGRTSISRSAEFDLLVWMCFDFSNDFVHLYAIPRACFSLEAGAERKMISIGSIVRSNNIVPSSTYCFHCKAFSPE